MLLELSEARLHQRGGSGFAVPSTRLEFRGRILMGSERCDVPDGVAATVAVDPPGSVSEWVREVTTSVALPKDRIDAFHDVALATGPRVCAAWWWPAEHRDPERVWVHLELSEAEVARLERWLQQRGRRVLLNLQGYATSFDFRDAVREGVATPDEFRRGLLPLLPQSFAFEVIAPLERED